MKSILSFASKVVTTKSLYQLPLSTFARKKPQPKGSPQAGGLDGLDGEFANLFKNLENSEFGRRLQEEVSTKFKDSDFDGSKVSDEKLKGMDLEQMMSKINPEIYELFEKEIQAQMAKDPKMIEKIMNQMQGMAQSLEQIKQEENPSESQGIEMPKFTEGSTKDSYYKGDTKDNRSLKEKSSDIFSNSNPDAVGRSAKKNIKSKDNNKK
mmetsp:Transcript_27183/g.31346  ORF Transcript_27183/g.31346 Transcript_27183/m.31346 type:complete len:209 (-) Transcript_27183:48-674(-)